MDSNANEQKMTNTAEEESFQERFCSESLKVTVLSDNGFDILKDEGLL